MDYNVSILLYSNYSPRSQQLLDALKSCPIDLSKVARMSSLCIDNTEIRKRIIKAQNLSINTVPAILLIYGNGMVEKYEGNQAFDWIEQTVHNNLPPEISPKPETPQEPETQTEPQSKGSDIRPKSVKSVKISENIIDMEDLDEDEELDINKPRVPIRNGPGGYDITNNFPESDSSSNKPDEKYKGDLMSQALAMQQERGD